MIGGSFVYLAKYREFYKIRLEIVWLIIRRRSELSKRVRQWIRESRGVIEYIHTAIVTLELGDTAQGVLYITR